MCSPINITFNLGTGNLMDLVKAAVKLLGAALLAAGIVCSATAATIVYDFDTFDDDTPLATG